MRTAREQLEILKRGTIEIIDEKDLLAKLEKSVATGVPLRVKLGVDPTAPDVHLGHTVVMRKLRQFQDLGHQAVLIVGDYTATVGDPSGKTKARPRLSHEEVLKNAETYQEQFFRVVDRNKTEIVYNGEWFGSLSFAKTTELMARITGEPARMWFRSIVGFGQYHYKYASGREGDACAAGFSPRKAATTIYLANGVGAYAEQLERLGTHTTGVGCLYITDLGKVDLAVLEAIVADSYGIATSGTYGHRAHESAGEMPSA